MMTSLLEHFSKERFIGIVIMKSVAFFLLFVAGALARPSSPVSYRTAPAQEAGGYGEQPAR